MDSFFNIRSFDDGSSYNCSVANKTTVITNAYNGIPETLILNVSAWVLLIILFTVLRHHAGDYGRLALVNNGGNRKRWTEIFYSRGTSLVEQPHTSSNGARRDDGPSSSSGANANGGLDEPRGSITSHSTADSTPLSPINYDQGIFSWIMITLKLRKEQVLLHTGPDAVYYLSFQKHLMLVMGIITVISLVVILPVNFLNGPANNVNDVNSFARTTMSNIPPDSAWLWVHVIVAIIYVPLIVLIMRRSSGRNAFKKAATRTIMITNISPNDRNKTVIRNYIQELFPDVSIEDVQIAYNISKLYGKNSEYERVWDAKMYCEQHRDRDSLVVS